MAESVDALVSNTSGATHPGSIPGLGTKRESLNFLSFFCMHIELYDIYLLFACKYSRFCPKVNNVFYFSGKIYVSGTKF